MRSRFAFPVVVALALAPLVPRQTPAQQPVRPADEARRGPRVSPAVALQRADSNRIGRILQAEDDRDSTAGAFDDGFRSANPRLRALARVALDRVRDPKFSGRDSLPGLAAPPHYSEPAWRLRYRALATKPVNCAALARALSDSAWPVRLRALDLATPACRAQARLVSTARSWASAPPASSAHARGAASWQPAAHAIVALSRMAPADARKLLPSIAASPIPWLRTYAARAAAALHDTSTLRHLAHDADDNVKEAALDQLAAIPGHVGDDAAIAALSSTGYQAVRAGARALRGSPRTSDVLRAALGAVARIRNDSSETSRDTRLALLDRVGELATAANAAALQDLSRDFDCVVARRVEQIAAKVGVLAPAHCRSLVDSVPVAATSFALGRQVRLRVFMADSSGGGSFTIRLRGDVAPVMAARVMALVEAHWYDGHPWFRVEPDFVIEGGGAGGNEYVGAKHFMRDELSSIPQVRGTVGMSTRGHDTGDGQWFINLRDNVRLTRDYTTFGEVIDGIDVVDGILEGDVIEYIQVLPGAR